MDELVTQRLRLRRFTAADEDHLLDLDSDPAVMRYLTGGAPTPRAVIRNEILPLFCLPEARGSCLGFWAAEAVAQSNFLGWFSLRTDAEQEDAATLGYRLRRSAWGQGLATEGARALIATAFQQGQIARVNATTYEDNEASIAVMRKLGMRFVRSFRMTDEDLDAVDTTSTAEAELWPGLDVEYAIETKDWSPTS